MGTWVAPYTRPNQTEVVVYKFSDIVDKIIPFFQIYPLQGKKLLDYKDFCKTAFLMKNKTPLMNTGRLHIYFTISLTG